MSKEEKNQDKNKEDCYTSCNKKYGSFDPKRLFCKKGCDSDEDSLEACKKETCSDLCIKAELGEDGNKLGAWSKFFSRAPTNPEACFEACSFGCNNKIEEDNDE